MKKTKGLLILALILTVALFTGCSSGYGYDNTKEIMVEPQTAPQEPTLSKNNMGISSDIMGMPSMEMEERGEDFTAIDGSKDEDIGYKIEPDKIITTVSMNFETKDFEKSITTLNQLLVDSKGYISNSNISNNDHYYETQSYKNGSFTIRIPRDNVTQFKSGVNEIGNVINENTSKDDVTQHYNDTESRYAVLVIKEERLLSLLERAEKIEDIIRLETELSNVIYEKERLKSTLVQLDDKIDYATFHFSIREVAKTTNTETVETTFMTKIKNAFDDSMYSFKKKLEDFAIKTVYKLPTLLIWLIILLGAYKLGIKKAIKRIKKEKTKKIKEDKSE